MKLSVDYEGMGIDFVKLDTKNNATARALASAVERGDLTGMSFMFSVDSDEWDDIESDHPTRRIKKIGTIVEISACTFPAYDTTTIEINARSREALDNARAALDNAKQKTSPDGELELLKEKTKTLLLG